jgi:hypothetical protein
MFHFLLLFLSIFYANTCFAQEPFDTVERAGSENVFITEVNKCNSLFKSSTCNHTTNKELKECINMALNDKKILVELARQRDYLLPKNAKKGRKSGRSNEIDINATANQCAENQLKSIFDTSFLGKILSLQSNAVIDSSLQTLRESYENSDRQKSWDKALETTCNCKDQTLITQSDCQKFVFQKANEKEHIKAAIAETNYTAGIDKPGMTSGRRSSWLRSIAAAFAPMASGVFTAVGETIIAGMATKTTYRNQMDQYLLNKTIALNQCNPEAITLGGCFSQTFSSP